MPLSKLKVHIAEILKAEGYIRDYRVDDKEHGRLIIGLKYRPDRSNVIAGMKRASRPGRRYYVGYRDIPRVHNGMGVAIVSTSHGVMTDRTARQESGRRRSFSARFGDGRG